MRRKTPPTCSGFTTSARALASVLPTCEKVGRISNVTNAKEETLFTFFKWVTVEREGHLSWRTERLITGDAEGPRRPAEYHHSQSARSLRSSRQCHCTVQEVQEVNKRQWYQDTITV